MVPIAANPEPICARASPRATLLVGALRAAGRRLERDGMFEPFGLALAAGDELVLVQALSGSAVPEVEDLIALLRTGLEAGRHARRYTVTVLVLESEIPPALGDSPVRAIELRLVDERSAHTLCFPHARENGRVLFEWPIWRGEVSSAAAR